MAALAGGCAAAAVLCGITATCGHLPAGNRGRRPSRVLVRLRAALSPARRRRIGLATGSGLLVLLILGWPVAALCSAAAVYVLPRMLSGREPRRQITRLEALELWTRRLAELMGASLSLEQALAEGVRIAPEPIRRPVSALAEQLRNHAAPEPALRRFGTELDDPAADLIATALILASSRRGPGLRDALGSLADAVTQHVRLRREVDAERASLRTTLLVITASVGALSVLCVFSPTFSAPYGTPLGQAVLALVAALYTAGLGWLRRLSVITIGARILHNPVPASTSAARRHLKAVTSPGGRS
jgi:Flp pilus assembly protein TadB